jgi:DNA-binding CsgD family transcriptional regulator/PAS domain-containing protein
MLNRLIGRRELKVRERALQETEEIHRGNSSDGGTGREEPSPSPSTIGDVKPGHHVCCIYETEEEHRAVVVPFLRQGLERGEKVLYIVDARDAEIILDHLRRDGLDPDPYVESGQLSILAAQDVYLKDGVFDPDAMIDLLRAETGQALAEGYSALRVTGEMSWALRGLPGSERLIEYEAKLNRFFPGSKCLAICQYDRRAFSAPLLLDVLTTHPIAVIGTCVYDNLYYVSPGDLLGPDPQAARLRAWMRTLDERKDGSRVPVEPHASSAFGENGELEYFHSFLADTAGRRRAEEERNRADARTKAVMQAIPDMMFVVRADGTYLDFIPADGQKPLFPPGEFLGKTVLEVIPTGLARRIMHHIAAALESGDVQSFEYELEVDGEEHNYEARFVAMAADEVLVMARDITAEKRVEEEQARRRARDELEGKVERAMLGRNPYGLTFREFSVLHLVARGAADKEIADQLGISTFTVNKHVANILGKMSACSRTEAGVRAHREGLIS